MSVDGKVAAAKDALKSLRKDNGHVMVVRWIATRKGRIPLILCEAGDH